MSSSSNCQLSHPELMSTEAIVEILKTRCIKMPEIHQMNRDEILDLYWHVALPKPQRDHSEGGYLNKKMASLRTQKSIPTALFRENQDLLKLVPNGFYNNNSNQSSSNLKRTKLIDNSVPSKKSRFDNSSQKSHSNFDVSPSKSKHQKITWP